MGNRGFFVLAFLVFAVNSLFAQISIQSLSSSSAVPGEVITINGSGFNGIVSSNVVFFGGVKATVSSASSSSLSVVVPTGAVYGPITVLNSSTQLQTTSSTYFTPVYTPSKGSTWTVNDFDPLVAPASTSGLFLEYCDVDGDGKVDIVESQTNPGGFRVKRNVSVPGTLTTTSFVNGTLISTGQTYLESITCADMNNDGKLDIVVAGSGGGTGSTLTGTLSIYLNSSTPGNIAFSAPIQRFYDMRNNSNCGGRAGSIKCADLDNNGWIDVILANSNYGYGGNSNGSCNVTLLGVIFSNNNGLFGSQQNITVSNLSIGSSRITQLECADMNNDKKLDLIFGARSRTYIFKNISTPNNLGTSSFVQAVSSLPSGDRMILVGDLDLDGDLDLGLAGRSSSTTLRLYKNTTNNQVFSFATSLSVTIGDRHSSVNNKGGAVGDITGDGRPELLIGGISPRILLNRIASPTINWSTASFVALTNISLSANVNSLAIIDLDHDGKSDIIGRSGTSGNVLALRRSNPIPEINVGQLALQYCPGTQLDVPYNATYAVNQGNVYTVQLSNSSGNFTSPVTIGSLSSIASSGVISCIIPFNTPAGTGYKIRVNASAPNVLGIQNSGNILINASVSPTVNIVSSQNLICLGTQVTYTATEENGGTSPIYTWRKNGQIVGTNGPSYVNVSPASGDVVFVQMQGNAQCNVNSATSNSITLTGVSVVTPSVNIVNTQSTICDFTTSVTYSANAINGGISPVFQWYKNGMAVGSNSSQWIDNQPQEGDEVEVQMTSNASCTTNPVVMSNVLVLQYTASSVLPIVSISSSQTNLCVGVNQILFNATIVNGGSSPTYQWKRNGVNVGNNSSQYVLSNPANNDQIQLVLTSNADCAAPTAVSSNTITLTTQSVNSPNIVISTPSNTLCGGGNGIQYTALTTNGGSNPLISWYKNGQLVGQGVNVFSNPTPQNGDVVQATLLSNGSCLTSTNATSNSITIVVNSIVNPTINLAQTQGTNPKCAGGFQQLTAQVSNAGNNPSYAWYRNGVIVNGATTAVYGSSTWAVDDIIYCQVIPTNSCQSTNLLVTPDFVVDENTLVNFYADADGDGFGDLNSTVSNCGSPTGYVDNSLDCDDNASNIYPGNNETCDELDNDCNGEIDEFVTTTFYADLDGDGYGDLTNSTEACSVPIGFVSDATDCDDLQLTYEDYDGDGFGGLIAASCGSYTNDDCNDSNLNISPLGVDVCGNGIDEDCSGSDDICVVPGCTTLGACNYSPLATIDDGSCILPVTPSVTVSSSDPDNSICFGLSLTFTATPTNGGSSPSYQWKLNGANVGTNSPTYTNASLPNGGIVTVVMTSNNACQTSSTANGNSITIAVVQNVTPSVVISSNDTDNSICAGTSVIFTATPTNGGSSPSYQWKLNGTNVGTNSPTYTNASLPNGGIVTVVMTSNNACQTSSTATGNSISTSVTVPIVWYLDADSDGYYVTTQTSCLSPGTGYSSNSGILGDCNDNSPSVNFGGIEICGNGIDEDCSGADEICAVLGCTVANACNYDPSATIDDGSCILPQPEVCNDLDDDCDGTIDDGLTGIGSVTFTTVSTALYPTCSTGNIASANLNLGANTAQINGTGPDMWYKLTAGYNTLRAGLSAAIGDNTLYLFQDLGTCLQQMDMVQLANTGGNQTLFSDELVVGENYYIVLHGEGGVYNASAKMCFNHFVASTCDHTYSNNTGVYSSSCSSFKAQYKANATSYIFNVLSGSQNGTNLNLTPWSYTTASSSSVVSRIGRIFPANQTATPIVYQVNVPAVYSVPDVLGNLHVLTATGGSACSVTMSPETTIALRAADRCPTLKPLSSYISIDRTICAAEKYEWEFSQVLPVAQAAIRVMGGVNSSILMLTNVPGIANGRTYNVRVRPVYYNGTKGEWGTAQCLSTAASGMIVQNGNSNPIMETVVTPTFEIYPNPTSGEQVQLIWKDGSVAHEEVTVWDLQGKRVMNLGFNQSESNTLTLPTVGLADGVYFFRCGQTVQRLVMSR